MGVVAAALVAGAAAGVLVVLRPWASISTQDYSLDEVLAAYDGVLAPGFDYAYSQELREVRDERQTWNSERRWFGEGGEEIPFKTDPAQCRHLAMFGPVGKFAMDTRGDGFLRGPEFLDPVVTGKLRYIVAAPLIEDNPGILGTVFFLEFESVESADEALSEFRGEVDCSEFVVQTKAGPSRSTASAIPDTPSLGDDFHAISQTGENSQPTRTDIVRYGDVLIVQLYWHYTDEQLGDYPEYLAELTAMNEKWTTALSSVDQALRGPPGYRG